jgi:very-short-patch-repair endonuclease
MKTKYDKIDWKNAQIDYDCGMTQTKIFEKYNIGRTVLNNAIKNGLFTINANRRFGHSHTEETKKKLSNIRKTYLKNNPDKHPWRKNTKFKSEPCEKLKEMLADRGYIFIPEFNDPSWEFNYSIDIAFPNNKIGIEVNGNQHYNNIGVLTEYYQKREDYLKSLGWKIYQLHYSFIYNQNFILPFIDSLNNDAFDFDYSKYNFITSKRNCKICGKGLNKNYKIETCNTCLNKEIEDKKIKERKQIILNSGIDFTKFGWVDKVSKLLGISHSQVKRWMEKYMEDFYKNNCFQKRTTNN